MMAVATLGEEKRRESLEPDGVEVLIPPPPSFTTNITTTPFPPPPRIITIIITTPQISSSSSSFRDWCDEIRQISTQLRFRVSLFRAFISKSESIAFNYRENNEIESHQS